MPPERHALLQIRCGRVWTTLFFGQVEGTSPENGKSPVVLQAHRNKHVSAIPALVHIHLRRSVHSFGDQCIPLSRARCLRDLIPSQVYKSLGAETLGDCGREMFICKGIWQRVLLCWICWTVGWPVQKQVCVNNMVKRQLASHKFGRWGLEFVKEGLRFGCVAFIPKVPRMCWRRWRHNPPYVTCKP